MSIITMEKKNRTLKEEKLAVFICVISIMDWDYDDYSFSLFPNCVCALVLLYFAHKKFMLSSLYANPTKLWLRPFYDGRAGGWPSSHWNIFVCFEKICKFLFSEIFKIKYNLIERIRLKEICSIVRNK